jgi:hypothetical protein
VSTKLCSEIKAYAPKKVTKIKNLAKKYDSAEEEIILWVAEYD